MWLHFTVLLASSARVTLGFYRAFKEISNRTYTVRYTIGFSFRKCVIIVFINILFGIFYILAVTYITKMYK